MFDKKDKMGLTLPGKKEGDESQRNEDGFSRRWMKLVGE